MVGHVSSAIESLFQLRKLRADNFKPITVRLNVAEKEREIIARKWREAMGRQSSLREPLLRRGKPADVPGNVVGFGEQKGVRRRRPGRPAVPLGWGGFMSEPFEAQDELKVRPPFGARRVSRLRSGD